MRLASRREEPRPRDPVVITILYVADLRRAADFYDSTFGWPKTVDAPSYVEYAANAGARVGLMAQASTTELLGPDLGARRPTDGCPRAEVYVRLDPLEETLARLEAAGARCTSPRAVRGWGDEAAYYLDPDGYVLGIARPVARPAH